MLMAYGLWPMAKGLWPMALQKISAVKFHNLAAEGHDKQTAIKSITICGNFP